MILDSPCKLYLKALLVQGWSVQRVEEHATELHLDYVSIQFLVYLSENSLPPDIFRPKDRAHVPSQEFLKKHGLEGLVPLFSPQARSAFQLLQKAKARECLEVLGLANSPIPDVVRTLADLKVRTTPEVVQEFYRLFWDVQSMDTTQLRAILHLRSPNVDAMAAEERLERVRVESGEEPTRAGDLPHPYRSEEPSYRDRHRARSRRRDGNRGLVRELERSQTIEARLREAQALKRAGWSDPRLVLAGLPPSPLTIALGRGMLGLPLSRLDLSKAYEILFVMLTHRLAHTLQDNHPEATQRIAHLVTSAASLAKLQKELGAGEQTLRNQIQAIALQSRQPGVYGEPDKLGMPGDFQISPYTKHDQETASEMVTRKKPETRAAAAAVDATEEG